MRSRIPGLFTAFAVAACGNVESSPPPDAVSAPAPDAMVDAPPPTARCDLAKPFGEPLDVFPGDPAPIRLASLSHDGRTAYLGRIGEAAHEDVYVATRDDLDAPWSAATKVDSLSSADCDLRVGVSGDGRSAVIDRLPVAGDTSHPRGLYLASRATASAPFSVRPLDEINTADGQSDPYLSPDGLHLYFGRNDGGITRLHRASRANVGARFERAAPIGGATIGVATSPWFTQGGRTVYFHAVRDGGLGTADLWSATRDSIDDDFGDAQNLAALSSSKVDFLTGLSPDECELYLTSDRTGVYRLYRAVRPR